ncbi:MAG: GHKL domain-containing protein [Eubacteriales bacterium]
MPLHLQVLFYTGKNVLMLFVISKVLNIFFTSKKQSASSIVAYALYIIFGTLSHFLIEIAWVNVIITVALVFVLLTNYLGGYKSKLVMACSWTVLTMITEIIVTMTFVALLGQSMRDVVFNELTNSISIVSHILILLVIVNALDFLKKKNQYMERFTIFNSLYVCIIPLCSVCILHFFGTISLLYSVDQYIIIFVCIIMIFMNIFFFVLFDKLRLSEKMKYEYALLKSEAENFSRFEQNANDTFDKIRTMKHDLKYHLLYLKSKTEEKSLQSLEDISRILDTLIEDTLSDRFTEYTKNKSINRILNYKLLCLEKRGIHVDIKVAINEDSRLDEISLYTIIGNALDNAIRNYDSSKSTLNCIVIRLISDGENLFIKVANPFHKKLKYKNGLPVTDKKEEELHGIGLQSIKNLVESKDGHIKVTSNDNIFNLEILLYDEIQNKNSCQE